MDDRNDTVPGTIMAPLTGMEGEPAARDSTRDASGDRYRVQSRLGKGGMGEVMSVRDLTIGRDVALKRIRKADPNDRVIQRFLREASIQGRLEHPAIVPVYDIGQDETGLPFFTMRKLAGTTLAKILDGNRREFPIQRLLRAFVEVCLAVEFAHVRGVIHRDLKPDNIVLGDFGEVYVLDWGVAKVIGEADGEFSDVASGSLESGEMATLPGTTIGTPGYMAPEQVRGAGELDPRCDVYALGCVLFEILANEMLHPKGNAGLASTLRGADARPSLRAPDRGIAPELDQVCVLATATDPQDRIRTARELGDRVQRFLDGDRDVARRRELAVEHLGRAQAAFAAGDADDHRRTAMREAASALALDPALAGAAELVGRLMLEPPRTTPKEVEREIHADDAQTTQNYARVGIRAYLAFLGFTPLLFWIGPAGSPYPWLVIGLVLINTALCWWGTTARPEGRVGWLAVTNALLLMVVARGFTPFLIAPALAAMSAMALGFTPTRSRITTPVGMVIATSIAVLGPWVAERAGWLSLTTTIDERGVLLSAAAVGGNETSTLIVAALYVLAMISAAASLANSMRARERTAKHALHLQAWQLRQLVPR